MIHLIGCSDTSKSTKETEKKEVVRLSFVQTRFEEVQKGCENEGCARVILDYPKFEGPEVSSVLNEKLDEAFKSIIGNATPESLKKSTLSAITDEFIRSYKKFKMAFPESQTGWYVKIKAEPTLLNQHFTCIRLIADTYTGGAHPLNETYYIKVSPGGKPLDSYSAFFNDVPALMKMAEDRFRSNQKIRPTQTLSDAGFIFPEDEFALPKNFGFTNSGLVLSYSPYEVSDYATGAIELVIPFRELEGNYRF